MISGRAEKRSVHSRLKLKLAEGTTLAMIAWSISLGSIWSRFNICSSQIAYSSDVRRPSVVERQTPLQSCPSKTAKTVFVLPASIVRSIFLSHCRKTDATGDQTALAVLGGDDDRAVLIHPGERPADAATGGHLAADAISVIHPFLPDGREAAPGP